MRNEMWPGRTQFALALYQCSGVGDAAGNPSVSPLGCHLPLHKGGCPSQSPAATAIRNLNHRTLAHARLLVSVDSLSSLFVATGDARIAHPQGEPSAACTASRRARMKRVEDPAPCPQPGDHRAGHPQKGVQRAERPFGRGVQRGQRPLWWGPGAKPLVTRRGCRYVCQRILS